MTPLTQSEAKVIASRRVSELELDADCKLALLDDSTVRAERGWIFSTTLPISFKQEIHRTRWRAMILYWFRWMGR